MLLLLGVAQALDPFAAADPSANAAWPSTDSGASAAWASADPSPSPSLEDPSADPSLPATFTCSVLQVGSTRYEQTPSLCDVYRGGEDRVKGMKGGNAGSQEECQKWCEDDIRCAFYSYWQTGWCETSATCNPENQRQDRYKITIFSCARPAPPAVGCFTGMGMDYEGGGRTSKSGATCQQWLLDSPHSHGYNDLPANYCRNPDGEDEGPWCYTEDPSERWNYCDIPKCPSPSPPPIPPVGCYTSNGKDYEGGGHTSVSGATCQQWARDYPHSHGYNDQPANYCRNPDGIDSPWCYTEDPNERWNYCDIPKCPAPSPPPSTSPSPPVPPSPPSPPFMPVLTFDACQAELVPQPAWAPTGSAASLTGKLELGQTHLIEREESRLAPRLMNGRETLVVFTPDEPLLGFSLRLAAFRDGEAAEPLGTLSLLATPLPILEQRLTSVPLEPYSTEAWHTALPADWMAEGVVLRIGRANAEGEVTHVFEHTLLNLAAPHTFTVTRATFLLFGEAADVPALVEKDIEPAQKIAVDWAPTVPFAQLNWVDSTTLVLDEIVVPLEGGGAQAVSDDATLRAVSRHYLEDGDHWKVLKDMFTRRMMLAHGGRGLTNTHYSPGSQPYSFGTTVGLGWMKTPNGDYEDLDDSPYAAGWTGWTAMWLGMCSNGFAHELGHSMSLAHFTTGYAKGKGIEDEYPRDGKGVEGHPWGYDFVRRELRTWYRVDAEGPVYEDAPTVKQPGEPVLDDMTGARQLFGKRDPMNGGESSNAVTCFPQYTPYHAKMAQKWATGAAYQTSVDDTPGLYIWDDAAHKYRIAAPEAGDEGFESGTCRPVLDTHPVLAVEVPVFTIFGAISADVSRIYKPMAWGSAPLFELPDPFGVEFVQAGRYNDEGSYNASSLYRGAQHFLKIFYADDSVDHALIASHMSDVSDDHGVCGWEQKGIANGDLHLFSVNIDLRREPTRVELRRGVAPYPNMVESGSVLLHSRDLEKVDPASLPRMLTVGGARVAPQAGLTISKICKEEECGEKASVTWRPGTAQLYFTQGAAAAAPTACGSGHTTLTVPVVNDAGEAFDLTVYVQRRVTALGGTPRSAPIEDATPWFGEANAEQSLVAWIPSGPNEGLPSGRWRSVAATTVHAWSRKTSLREADELMDEVPITVDFWITPPVGCYTGDGADYAGGASTTLEGKTCQTWAIAYNYNHLPMNYCRNTDGEDAPWCYHPDDSWDYCDIPVCPRPPSPPRAPDSQADCHIGDGTNPKDYEGSKHVTAGGIQCQSWDRQYPHTHGYGYVGSHNFCRNPDGEPAAWCYTADPNYRWDFCDIPKCLEKGSGSDEECIVGDGAKYDGSRATTASGWTCQNWNSQAPHGHRYGFVGAHNYCRNPDGEPAPWCYTTNPNKRWELCDIAACGDEIGFFRPSGLDTGNDDDSSSSKTALYIVVAVLATLVAAMAVALIALWAKMKQESIKHPHPVEVTSQTGLEKEQV